MSTLKPEYVWHGMLVYKYDINKDNYFRHGYNLSLNYYEKDDKLFSDKQYNNELKLSRSLESPYDTSKINEVFANEISYRKSNYGWCETIFNKI